MYGIMMKIITLHFECRQYIYSIISVYPIISSNQKAVSFEKVLFPEDSQLYMCK